MNYWSLDSKEHTPKEHHFMKAVSAILKKQQEFTAAQVKWAISLWEAAQQSGFRP